MMVVALLSTVRGLHQYIHDPIHHQGTKYIDQIFVILLSLFVKKNLGVHVRLSKCSRGTWSEKGWEPLLYNH